MRPTGLEFLIMGEPPRIPLRQQPGQNSFVFPLLVPPRAAEMSAHLPFS